MLWMIQKLKSNQANTLNHMNSPLYLKTKDLCLSFTWISSHFLLILKSFQHYYHCLKSVQIQSYFWFVFSCIQSEYRKIRTRNNYVFGHFSRSVFTYKLPFNLLGTTGYRLRINKLPLTQIQLPDYNFDSAPTESSKGRTAIYIIKNSKSQTKERLNNLQT